MLAENSFADILVLGRQCPFDSPPIISGCYFCLVAALSHGLLWSQCIKAGMIPGLMSSVETGSIGLWNLTELRQPSPAQPSQGRAGHVPVVSALGRRDRDMVNDTPITAGLCLGTGTAGAGLG